MKKEKYYQYAFYSIISVLIFDLFIKSTFSHFSSLTYFEIFAYLGIEFILGLVAFYIFLYFNAQRGHIFGIGKYQNDKRICLKTICLVLGFSLGYSILLVILRRIVFYDQADPTQAIILFWGLYFLVLLIVLAPGYLMAYLIARKNQNKTVDEFKLYRNYFYIFLVIMLITLIFKLIVFDFNHDLLEIFVSFGISAILLGLLVIFHCIYLLASYVEIKKKIRE